MYTNTTNVCHHRTRCLCSSFILNRLIVSYPKIIEKLKEIDCTSRAVRPFVNIYIPSSFHSNWNVFNIVSVLCTCKHTILNYHKHRYNKKLIKSEYCHPIIINCVYLDRQNTVQQSLHRPDKTQLWKEAMNTWTHNTPLLNLHLPSPQWNKSHTYK